MEEEVSFETGKKKQKNPTQYNTQKKPHNMDWNEYGSYISWMLLIKENTKAKIVLFCSVVSINISVSTQYFNMLNCSMFL